MNPHPYETMPNEYIKLMFALGYVGHIEMKKPEFTQHVFNWVRNPEHEVPDFFGFSEMNHDIRNCLHYYGIEYSISEPYHDGYDRKDGWKAPKGETSLSRIALIKGFEEMFADVED